MADECRRLPRPVSERFPGRLAASPRNLTFARVVAKVSDGGSGRSNVASIDREKIPAERLHPKTVYSHCRPFCDIRGARFAASKQPIGTMASCLKRLQQDQFDIRGDGNASHHRWPQFDRRLCHQGRREAHVCESSLANSRLPQCLAQQDCRTPGQHSRQWQMRPMYCPSGSAKKISAPLLRAWA